MSTSTWIILGVIVVVVLWVITIYNGLVTMRQRVNQAFADVDVQLKQRHDLIPNLVETVKGYAAHERGTLEEVVKARNAAMSAQGPAQQAAAENMLSGALRQLFALSEAYPDLKANANFQQLQAELTDSRTRSRRRGASSTTRCRNTIPASSASRRRCSPPRSASRRRTSSTSASDRKTVERGAAGEVLDDRLGDEHAPE